MSTLRERIAPIQAHVSPEYWRGLVSHADEAWALSILSKYRAEADSILRLLRAEVEGIENPYYPRFINDTSWVEVPNDPYKLFEEFRQAVLKALE